MEENKEYRRIVSLAGPEKGKIITVVDEGGESRKWSYCSVCGCNTYLSFDYEELSGRHFCTKHWAVLRCTPNPAVRHNPR